MIKEYVEKIYQIVKDNPYGYSSMLFKNKSNKYLYDYIMEETKMYTDIKLSSRIYMIITNNFSFPKCPTCGKELRHNIPCNPMIGFLIKFCSNSCAQKNSETREKIINSNREKHGCDYYQKTEEYKEKLKEILRNRTKEEKEKSNIQRKKTCMDKYGVDSVSKVTKIHDKCVNTFLNRSKEEKLKSLNKKRKTCLEKYGNEKYINIHKILETRNKHTEEEKKNTIAKRKLTCLKIYGVNCTLNTKEAKSKTLKKQREIYYDTYIYNNKFVLPLFSRDEYIENGGTEQLKWKCLKCNNIFHSKPHEYQSHIARCLKCYPLNSNISNGEKELASYIKSLIPDNIILNTRDIISPNELDVYIPSRNIAFEYDGIFWHSENMGTPTNYHLQKTEKCLSKNINLIHIFESEWLLHTDIVKSYISEMFGKSTYNIQSEECTINYVNPSDANDFLTNNHIFGNNKSPINIGLFYDSNIVSLISLSNINNTWIIDRLCNKINYTVIDGYSRLIHEFEINYNPNCLICEVDRRWFNENTYTNLGFTLNDILKPNYWYFKHGSNIMESPIKYTKKFIKETLNIFDDSKSADENMLLNDYLKIFDCGKYVFIKKYTS